MMRLLLTLFLTTILQDPCYNREMIDTDWVDDSHGLSLYPGPRPYRDNENGVLFYLEYILLKEAKGEDITGDIAEFKYIVEQIRTYTADGHRVYGLYDRGAKESQRPDKKTIRTISHDNLTAISAFDARYGDGSEAANIAIHGFKNQLRYDNVYPESPRWITIQWPTDLFFWSLSSNKWYLKLITYPILPFFLIRSYFSNVGPWEDCSGRLLNFVRFASHRDKSLLGKILWKIHVKMMVDKYGDNWIHEIMKVYFKEPTHPLHNLSDNVKF